jgi:hypothetical protein
MRRTYECRAKLSWCTLCITANVEYDKIQTVAEMEQELKEYAAQEFTVGKYKFTAKDIKLKRI